MKANNPIIDWRNHCLTFQPQTHMEVAAASHVAASEWPKLFFVDHFSMQVGNSVQKIHEHQLHTLH